MRRGRRDGSKPAGLDHAHEPGQVRLPPPRPPDAVEGRDRAARVQRSVSGRSMASTTQQLARGTPHRTRSSARHRVAQVEQQAAEVDEVELADARRGRGRRRCSSQPLDRASRAPRVRSRSPSPAPLRAADRLHGRRRAARPASPTARGSSTSMATTSAAPRRSISKAQKPSNVPTSRQRLPFERCRERQPPDDRAGVEPARRHHARAPARACGTTRARRPGRRRVPRPPATRPSGHRSKEACRVPRRSARPLGTIRGCLRPGARSRGGCAMSPALVSHADAAAGRGGDASPLSRGVPRPGAPRPRLLAQHRRAGDVRGRARLWSSAAASIARSRARAG